MSSDIDYGGLGDMFEPEELHPDLVPYLNDEGTRLGWPVLQHPLVYAVPYLEPENKRLNAQYEYKLGALDEAFDEGKWGSYVFLHERPYRINAFRDICDYMDDKEYWELLSSVWSDTENLHAWGDVESLFERPGREDHFMDDGDRRAFRDMFGDEIHIHRGHTHLNQAGWSWTSDYDRAMWFATRFDADGKVTSTTVAKDKVLAYFTGRGENEIVVNPKDLVL